MRAGSTQRVGQQGENGGVHNDCYARGKYNTAILCAVQRKMHYLGDCPDLFWRILMNHQTHCVCLVHFSCLSATFRGMALSAKAQSLGGRQAGRRVYHGDSWRCGWADGSASNRSDTGYGRFCVLAGLDSGYTDSANSLAVNHNRHAAFEQA